jgi:hypothetical protein
LKADVLRSDCLSPKCMMRPKLCNFAKPKSGRSACQCRLLMPSSNGAPSHDPRDPMACSLLSDRDRRKLTFYFTADKRIDFRELVRELFRYVSPHTSGGCSEDALVCTKRASGWLALVRTSENTLPKCLCATVLLACKVNG